MEYKGERAQRRLDELLSEIDDWATEAFWTGFYSGCERERELKDEINWLNAELHGAELKAQMAERKCYRTAGYIMGVGYGDEIYWYDECSACHKRGLEADHKYCPNCGAKVMK